MIYVFNDEILDEKQRQILATCLRMDYGEEVTRANSNNTAPEADLAVLCGMALSNADLSSPLVGIQVNQPGQMKTHIIEYRKLPGVKIMVTNYRFFQFLEEFIWYMNDPSYEALITFFCRNLIPLEERSGQYQSANFYKRIEKSYGKYFPYSIPRTSDFISSMLFIVYHEAAHMLPDIYESTTALLDFVESLDSEESFFYYPDKELPGSEELEHINYKEELSCDFTALYSLHIVGFARTEDSPDAPELSLAVMALCAEAIYQLYEQMTSALVNQNLSQLRLALSRLSNDVINCRMPNLFKLVTLSGNLLLDSPAALLTNGKRMANRIINFFEDVEQFFIHYPEYQELYAKNPDET